MYTHADAAAATPVRSEQGQSIDVDVDNASGFCGSGVRGKVRAEAVSQDEIMMIPRHITRGGQWVGNRIGEFTTCIGS